MSSYQRVFTWLLSAILVISLASNRRGLWAKHPQATWTSSRLIGSPDPPPPYRIERVLEDVPLELPTEMIRIPQTDRWCVLQLDGTVLSFNAQGARDVTTMIRLQDTNPQANRCYGIVFHLQYPEEPWCYIAYRSHPTAADGTRLSRFRVNVSESPTIDAASETVFMTWAATGHAGGSLHFGPDGYLYLSIGDGQPPNPPDEKNTGQDLSDLEASILRIDVNRSSGDLPYSIPADNPFIDMPDARDEIWAYGFRNPWKMSFHPERGTLWAGDVGWEMMEMVYRVDRGANYGWSLMEGSQVVKRDGDPPRVPITPPIVEHTHLESRSITGGYFWHSPRLGELDDTYIYGDYITGKIWGLRHDGEQVTWQRHLADTPIQVICFALDRDGEVLVVGYDGTIHRLVETQVRDTTQNFPRTLSETGLFDSVAEQVPARGVLPYAINAHHWADGTVSSQWIALPDDTTLSLIEKPAIQFGENRGQFAYPDNAVLAKTVSYLADVTDPQSLRRLETQVLHRSGDQWNAYNYVWNEDQADAVLLENTGTDRQLVIRDPNEPGGQRQQTWHHASRDECLLCHIWKAGTVQGFVPEQLNRVEPPSLADLVNRPGGGKLINQLTRLNQLGLFDKEVQTSEATISPTDASFSLEARARSYLHLNCASCHRRGGGGTAAFVLEKDTPVDKMGIIDALPTQGRFHFDDPRVVAPGDPYRSVLMYRLVKSGRGQMPQFGTQVIDEQGAKLIHDWIVSLIPAEQKKTLSLAEKFADLATVSSPSQLDEALEPILRDAQETLALSIACGDGSLDEPLREWIVDHTATHARGEVRELFERFLPEARRVKRLGHSIDVDALLALSGDAAAGEELFWTSSDVTCRQCHRVGDQGIAVGPNLDSIGLTQTPAEILASIIDPSAKIDPKYQAHQLLTVDGQVVSGLIVEEDEQQLRIVDATGKEQTIALEQIEIRNPVTISVMPERLLSGFTAQQAADLLAYLSAQKQPTAWHHRTYRAPRIDTPIRIDGVLDEPAWQLAEPTEPFLFTWLGEGEGPRQPTRVRLLWDSEHLYAAFECTDRNVVATRTERDDQVFRDDCVELFASPEWDHPENYFNLEINALGTLLDNYRPRGVKPEQPWNPDGIRIGVHIAGTLNDPSDVDQGWTVEVAIPLKLFQERMAANNGSRSTVRPGDRWRLNLHRLEDDMRIKSQWSAGDRNRESFHTPEYFGTLEFVSEPTTHE